MQYRKFGNTDLRVSEIGFGAWAIGGNAKVGNTPIGWGKADDNISLKAIHAALDAGINFFDTADFYGLGHSESLLGNGISNQKEVIFATKVGHRNINESIQLDYSKEYILSACEASLKRLKRDYIDYYQLHSARLSHFESEECIAAMNQLQAAGKIRYWGLSLNTFYPEPEAEFLVEKKEGQGFQLVFNIINQKAKNLIQSVHEKGYGVIARMPLQFGLLTGKFNSMSVFAEDDHRSFRLNEKIMAPAIALLEEKIWPLCNQYGISKSALALSYILSYPGVSTVIPGIRTVEHVQQNTSGILKLQAEDLALIEHAYQEGLSAIVDLMEKQG